MKKIFTTAFAFALFATSSYGQRLADLSIQSIDGPTEIVSGPSQSAITMNIAVFNDGPDDLMAGDTVFYSMQLGKDGQLITQTSQANQGIVQRGPSLTRNVNAGDTFHFVITLYTGVIMELTTDVSMTAIVIVANRPDLPFEGQSTIQNNVATKSGILWYNEAKWPLSVSTIEKGALTIYPNPSSSNSTIQMHYADASTPAVVSVYNMNGALVYTSTQTGSNFSPMEINTSTLENGIYVVKVDNGEVQTTSKLTVQH